MNFSCYIHSGEGKMMNGIESFANMILKEACRVQASDLHIVPRQKDVVVQLRIGKDLMTKYCIEKEFGEKLVSHFKFLASMDIGERRKPQNGSLYLQMDGQEVYLRLSTLPTVYQESLVIRLHLQASIQPLSHLSLFPSTAKKLLSFTLFSWITRIYWTDWFGEDNNNVCIIRGN